MTYGEFRERLKAAGLRVRDLAEVLGMRPTSISNYRAKGSVPPHLAAIATLAAELAKSGRDVRALLRSVPS